MNAKFADKGMNKQQALARFSEAAGKEDWSETLYIMAFDIDGKFFDKKQRNRFCDFMSVSSDAEDHELRNLIAINRAIAETDGGRQSAKAKRKSVRSLIRAYKPQANGHYHNLLEELSFIGSSLKSDIIGPEMERHCGTSSKEKKYIPTYIWEEIFEVIKKKLEECHSACNLLIEPVNILKIYQYEIPDAENFWEQLYKPYLEFYVLSFDHLIKEGISYRLRPHIKECNTIIAQTCEYFDKEKAIYFYKLLYSKIADDYGLISELLDKLIRSDEFSSIMPDIYNAVDKIKYQWYNALENKWKEIFSKSMYSWDRMYCNYEKMFNIIKTIKDIVNPIVDKKEAKNLIKITNDYYPDTFPENEKYVFRAVKELFPESFSE